MSDHSFHEILEKLQSFPVDWDGKASIQTLKEENFHWRQMEWIGFYFEWLCRTMLSPPLTIPGPRYGKVEFDAFWRIPWDFKAHVSHNPNGTVKQQLIINDKEAIFQAIRDYSQLGLIVATGEAVFNDKDGSFRRWHSQLKGRVSQYEKTRIADKRPSRVRKMSLHVREFDLFVFDEAALQSLETYDQGRNADGSPRKPKFRLNLRSTDPVAVLERTPGGILKIK